MPKCQNGGALSPNHVELLYLSVQQVLMQMSLFKLRVPSWQVVGAPQVLVSDYLYSGV
jgi:hypothetical protein